MHRIYSLIYSAEVSAGRGRKTELLSLSVRLGMKY
nr:MAG TPA: hypothetical protein [Caudoviricetes sp.]